jgi:NAD(P)-dependent dehydrogenase (short-subunit alcohol dehydrogenase family)
MGFITDLFYSQLFFSLPLPTTSLSSQTIIITGSNTGLGFEAANHCVRLHAAKVILAVRDVSKGFAARAAIEAAFTSQAQSTAIEVWHLDLLSTASVKAFAEKAMGLERIDVVLANAGVAMTEWKEVEGFESTILVNVICTELLVLLLLPKLREMATKWGIEPRVSLVVSESHFVAKFGERNESDIFAALSGEEDADMDDRYV